MLVLRDHDLDLGHVLQTQLLQLLDVAAALVHSEQVVLKVKLHLQPVAHYQLAYILAQLGLAHAEHVLQRLETERLVLVRGPVQERF